MRKIAFARDHMQISEILISSHGLEAEQLYFNVGKAMWAPFKKYINKLYDGENAPLEKAKSYDNIDYTEANDLIAKYRESKKLENAIK